MHKPRFTALTAYRTDWQPIADMVFWVGAGLFLAAAIVLAVVNQNAGSPDSKNNLDTARNLARGHGFTSNIIQQFYVPQSLPHPETIRPPGIPFLMAGLFCLFGISLALPVLLNGATVLATAWFLRRAIQVAGGGWFASVAGLLVLISGHYQMVSLWNNNLLVLCTVGLLLVAAKSVHHGWPAWKVVVACAVVTAMGFFVKPTFILTAIPVAAVLLLADGRCGWLPGRRPTARGTEAPGKPRRYTAILILLAARWRLAFQIRPLRFAAFLVLAAALTSPYWGRNLVRFGHPLYSPWTSLRLAVRYGGMPHGTFNAVRLGQPVTYGEMREIHGFDGLVREDLRMIGKALWRALIQNPPIYLLILVAPVVFPAWRRRWEYWLAIAAMAEPVFSAALYWHVESRYLWPIYPCLLYLVALGVRDYRLRPMPRPAGIPRLAIATGLLGLAVAFGIFNGQREWARFVHNACQSPPSWINQVAATEPDAVILTDDPFSVAWYAERKAVGLPGGPRRDLLQVVELYRPTHCLLTGRGAQVRGPVALGQTDLRILAQEASGPKRSWQFYETAIPAAIATAPSGVVR